MKRLWIKALLIAAVLALSVGAAYADEAPQPAPGTVIGHVYATDVVTYLDGAPIRSFNIGGKMAVLLQDLPPYGFSVRWDPEVSTAYVDTIERPETHPVYTPPAAAEIPGQVIGNIYATEVSVEVNGLSTPAFNLGGKMAVCLRDLAEDNTNNFWQGNPNRLLGYSNSGFKLTWNPDTMTSHLDALHIGDPLEVDGAEYPVVGFLSGTFLEGNANPVFYRDGEVIYGWLGSRMNDFSSEENFQVLLEDCSWSFTDGAVHLKLPRTMTDHFFYDYAGELEQYPNQRGIEYGVYKAREGVAAPIVSVPVFVERNGRTTEYQVDACVFYGMNFDNDLFKIIGLPVIEHQPAGASQ